MTEVLQPLAIHLAFLAALLLGELRLLRAILPLGPPVFSTDIRILGKRLLWSVVSFLLGIPAGYLFLPLERYLVSPLFVLFFVLFVLFLFAASISLLLLALLQSFKMVGLFLVQKFLS